MSSTWQTGFIAHFTIVNASAVPMTGLAARIRLAGGRIHLTHVEQHVRAIRHALCRRTRELESHHSAGRFRHRWYARRADRLLLATVELRAEQAISLHLEAIGPAKLAPF